MELLLKLVSGLKPEAQDLKIVILLSFMFIMLRDEIRENKVMDMADKKVIEFRLNALEDKRELAYVPMEKFAILAEKPEIEDAE
jgi:hypothetical protein